ncbi:MAG: hypothetical protein GC204_08540 [Chloroflexi bacterium]|nr:hypothetical protein [Chloroflexota bacterium]
MRSRNFVIFAGAVAAVFVLALLLRQPVTQRAVIDDQNILVKSDYHVSTAHPGDLVVMGSRTVAIDDGGSVMGNASLIGDNVTVAGTVDGGLTALGKNVVIDPTASINGHTALMGTNITVGGNISGSLIINGETITILPTASIDGSINVCGKSINDQRINSPAITCNGVDLTAFAPLLALRSGAQTDSHQLPLFALVLLTAFGGVLLTGMSVLSVTFFPRQISHIEEAMRLRPRSFVGVGIATYALEIGVFFALLFLLAILPPLGLLLIPVFLILSLILLLMGVSGLITLVVMLGDWLLRRVTRPPMPPLIAAVIGSLALSLGLSVVALLPYGLVISFVLLGAFTSVGLGASLFTRVGTRPVGRTYFIQG